MGDLDCRAGRYEDNGDGTVTDCRTGLIWLKDASCDGLGPNVDSRGTWQEATDAAAALGDGMCGLTDGSAAGDWRIPSKSQWMAMVASANSQTFTVPSLTDARGTSKWTTDGDEFIGVEPEFHWSSSPNPLSPPDAWLVSLQDGGFGTLPKGTDLRIWPVRGVVSADLLDGMDSSAFGGIHGVLAGSGLAGGGLAGTPTLSVATDGINATHLAENSVEFSELAPNAVGGSELQPIWAVTVECDGECTDSTLGQICDVAVPGSEPIAVSCERTKWVLTATPCGGDNTCSAAAFGRSRPLHWYCEDTDGTLGVPGTGNDATVYCIDP